MPDNSIWHIPRILNFRNSINTHQTRIPSLMHVRGGGREGGRGGGGGRKGGGKEGVFVGKRLLYKISQTYSKT